MNKLLKRAIQGLAVLFILLNISAAIHAYHFTHFADSTEARSNADELSLIEKTSILFLGISNPKPVNYRRPAGEYKRVNFKSNTETLEAWYIEADSSKGEVILFHGYAGQKASLLSRAALFRQMGFNTLLVDFRGSGGSTGNTTTIGYHESNDVKSAVDYLVEQGKANIYLFGTSMGAAAALKSASESNLVVSGLIIECPFGSLLQSASNRFERMGVPAFPAAHLLVFWGGVETGFWGHGHNPSDFAKQVTLPTLLIYGEQDSRVKRFEVDDIYNNLAGEKELLLFPSAGHGNYLATDSTKWHHAIEAFLK